MAIISLSPGSYILMGKTDTTSAIMSMSTVKQYLDRDLVTGNYSNGSCAKANDRTSASTNSLTTKYNSGTTKRVRFACYFTQAVYNEMNGYSMKCNLVESDTGTSVSLDNIVFGTSYSWYDFSRQIESVTLDTGETIYGICGSFTVPSNLTGSAISSYRFRIELTPTSTQYGRYYLPVYFICYVSMAAYTYSTAYAISWNTTSTALGPINPGSSKTITCTLKNNERTDSYAASTSGRIYVSAINLVNATPTVFMPNTDGSCWLNKNGTTYPTALIPLHASGTGSYSGTASTTASISSTATGTYIPCGSTCTFTVTLTAPSIAAQRRYYNPRLTFKCVGVTSDTTETMTDYFYSNGMTPSGSYKLRSLSNYRVLDFQTDVENAGSASVTSTGTQPILSTDYNANYVGHLAYDGSTAALSPRFKCIDMSKTIVTANEYVSSGPTPIPTILRTCSSCGHTQSVSTSLVTWTCDSCGAINHVRIGGSTLTMLNGSNCVTCDNCNNCLSNCPASISVLGPDLIENADMCMDCRACFDAGINTVCPVDVKFLVMPPLLDL